MSFRWLFTLAMLTALVTAVGFDVCRSTVMAQESMTQMSPERQMVYDEIESAFGFVPGFFKTIPDVSLAHEWNTMKSVQMEPGAIPNKYRELIGLAVAAVRGCEFCTYFHTEFAKLNGATDAELEDAVHFAKSNVGWSTYLHGMQYDLAQFKSDVDRICSHARQAETPSN